MTRGGGYAGAVVASHQLAIGLQRRSFGEDMTFTASWEGEHHGVHCTAVLDPNPRGVGGGPEGRGGEKIFSVLAAFLNSPFHPEHFEYTQLG